jgi:hypothetical protein
MPAAGQLALSSMVAVSHYYQDTFPALKHTEAEAMAHYNPISVYMSLLRLEGTYAMEAVSPLDDKDDWND